jgi:hypothetical protein
MPRKLRLPRDKLRLARLLHWARRDPPPRAAPDSILPFVNRLLATVDSAVAPFSALGRKLVIYALARELERAGTRKHPLGSWQALFPEWLRRIEEGEHLADILREQVPAAEHRKTRSQFDYWRRTRMKN